jgi:predicted deacylase
MRLLLIAGTHGVEPQSSAFLNRLLSQIVSMEESDENPENGVVRRSIDIDFNKRSIGIFSISNLIGLTADTAKDTAIQINDLELNVNDFKDFKIIAIPALNPHGLKNFTRHNHHDVDLNRNMPSQNWQSAKFRIDGEKNPYYPGDFPASEIETQLLTKLIEGLDFDLIISFHTNHFIRFPNPPQVNYDGLGTHKDFAIKLALDTELEFTEDIGYPTPGSLGSYSKDKGLDCITIEFDDNITAEELNTKYLKAFTENISYLFKNQDSKLNTKII